MAALPTAVDRTTSIPQAREISDTTQIATNKTAGVLLEGVANIFDEGVKGTYKEITRQAEKSVTEGYDDVNQRFGVDDAALQSRMGLPVKDAQLDTRDDGSSPEGDRGTSDATDFSSRGRTGQELPAPADRTLNRIQRIQRANEAGKLSPSEYNAAMEAEVRRVRAEYPGFRDEIDAKMRQITGITPANALRASMLRDQIALQRADASGQTFERNYRKANDKYVAPGEENLPFAEYRQKVVQAQQQEHQITVSSQRLALDAAKGKGVSTQATQVVTQGLTAEADRIMAPALLPLEKMIAAKKDGEGFSVTEIQNLRPVIAKIRLNLDNSFEAYMDRPTDFDPAHPERKGSGPTFRTLINDPNAVAAMKKDYVGRAAAFEQSLTDQHFGVLNYQKLFAESTREAADAGLMQQRGMAVLASVKKNFGDNVANIVVGDTSNGTPVLPTLQKAILAAGKLDVITPGGENPSKTAERLKDAAKKPGAEPVTALTYRTQMSGLVKTMADPNLPDDAKTNAVRTVINDLKYIYTFKVGAGQSEAYTTLTSPEVTDSVAKMAVADPKLWQEYRGAAVKNFTGVYRSAAVDAQSVNKVEGWKTVFDPKSNQFYAEPEKGRGPIEDDARRANMDVYQGRLDQLNQGLRVLSYILKKDGEEVGPKLLQIATAMGVDPKAPKEGFWDGLAQAVSKATDKAAEAVSPNIR